MKVIIATMSIASSDSSAYQARAQTIQSVINLLTSLKNSILEATPQHGHDSHVQIKSFLEVGLHMLRAKGLYIGLQEVSQVDAMQPDTLTAIASVERDIQSGIEGNAKWAFESSMFAGREQCWRRRFGAVCRAGEQGSCPLAFAPFDDSFGEESAECSPASGPS